MYFHRTFNLYKGDIKKTWLIIDKTFSNKKTSDLSQSFSIGNKLTSDPNSIRVLHQHKKADFKPNYTNAILPVLHVSYFPN